MATIKKVAIIGAGGNLGPAVVKALLDAGFDVTVLSRIDSTSTFPSAIHVQKTDYNSASSLTEAFKGQDAVVSTIATAALGEQQKIIDAAANAGVKRFIPSEYGINTQNLWGGPAKILSTKTQTVEYLRTLSTEHKDFSWTGLSVSMFFDWGLKFGSLGFSLPNKSATIFDSGNEPFNGTNLATIGLAIASILKNPEATANRYLDIASFSTTQNAILSILEEETGTKWNITKVSTADSLKTGDEKLAKGDKSAFGDFLKVHLFKDGEGKSTPESKLANKELGLPKEDLRVTIKAVVS